MQNKRWIMLGLPGLCVVILLIALGDQEEQRVADELSRKQQQVSTLDVPATQGKGPLPGVLRLTDSVIAERDSAATWVVRSQASSAEVELPFAPIAEIPTEEPTAKGSVTLRESPYLGANACAECHSQKHAGFVETAHHKTSGLLSQNTQHGHFDPPHNVLRSPDPTLTFTMQQRDNRCFQKVSLGNWSLDIPLDVVTGSAKTGQSFLYWHGDALFQSHVSYLSELNEWVSSPGYNEFVANYTRPIRSGCLECHITYIEPKAAPNFYHRDTAIWGISCERCHGPGREHVEFHRANRDEKNARFIKHPSDLSRRGQLDLCGQCHSGSFKLLGEAFSYLPGDDLQKHHQSYATGSPSVGGIHTSNQLVRLSMSKCFQDSEMTCTSCHNPHQNQRGQMEVFTKQCLACHQPRHCGMSEQLGERIADNCISCHMPMGDNKGMVLSVTGGSFNVTMIDHYIRVDKEASETYLKK